MSELKNDAYTEAVRIVVAHLFGYEKRDARDLMVAVDLIGAEKRFNLLGWATYMALKDLLEAALFGLREAVVAEIEARPKPPMH